MPRLPVVSGPECVRVLQRVGFVPDRQEGSHVTLVREGTHLTVPCHGGKDLKPGTLHNIIKQAGLTVAEFVELLHSRRSPRGHREL
ncbi:MAG: type II toxin-antitoxin system HicA family toxin [Armatimonadetes bacterium]|nr:type II toxin-antitoxin system HicA family toxin [Armatimonadota bacterium]